MVGHRLDNVTGCVRRGVEAFAEGRRPSRGRSDTKRAGSRLSVIDPLTTFGALSVGAMLVFYALEPRSAGFVLAFAAACLASSAYGFLQGAWPFGVVELVWSGVAARRWWSRSRAGA